MVSGMTLVQCIEQLYPKIIVAAIPRPRDSRPAHQQAVLGLRFPWPAVPLRQSVSARGVQILAANIGCQSHLQTATALPVMHWIELLDERLA